MQYKNLTSPETGLTFKAVVQSDGSIVLPNPLGHAPITAKRVDGGYLLPPDAFNYRPTMTALQASKALGVSHMMVTRLCQTGTIRATKQKGQWVIDSRSLKAYKRGRETNGNAKHNGLVDQPAA